MHYFFALLASLLNFTSYTDMMKLLLDLFVLPKSASEKFSVACGHLSEDFTFTPRLALTIFMVLGVLEIRGCDQKRIFQCLPFSRYTSSLIKQLTIQGVHKAFERF